MDNEINLENAILFVDSNCGVYMPQRFAMIIARNCISGVSDEDFKILLGGPDSEYYWEIWEDVLNNAIITEDTESRTQYFLHMDEDLWLVELES